MEVAHDQRSSTRIAAYRHPGSDSEPCCSAKARTRSERTHPQKSGQCSREGPLRKWRPCRPAGRSEGEERANHSRVLGPLVASVVVTTARIAPVQERALSSTMQKPEADPPKQSPSLPYCSKRSLDFLGPRTHGALQQAPFLRNRFRKAELTLRHQSSGESPAVPPHSIETDRG
jgi:hypothetical protein